MSAVTLVTLDFETYYADDYTLSKMTAEEYIRDPRFQVIGFGIKINGGPSRWFTGTDEEIRRYFTSSNWSDKVVLGHNMSEFDSLIMTHHFGVRPRAYLCTLAMARAIHGGKVSKSLGALAKLYGLQDKGDEVVYAKNKRREDFSPDALMRYGEYCKGDCDITYDLYNILRKELPAAELRHVSLFTKMFAEPRFVLDQPLLERYLQQITARKAQLIIQCGLSQAELRSDSSFAAALISLGVDPPMKYSKKRKNPDGTPMLVYAFAKTDEAMQELAEDDDEDVQALVSARLGVKTTIEESRVTRFIDISKRGMLPVPLVYGKTHTHRAAGGGKINMQNMGRGKPVDKRTPAGTLIATANGPGILQGRRFGTVKGKEVMQIKTDVGVFMADDCHCVGLRDMLRVPEGKAVVVADSSNIELRVAHCLAGQMDTVAKIRAGADLYCDFATDLYSRPITKADKMERQHGKVAMLQLQYQSGARSLKNAARVMGRIRLTDDVCENTVQLFRNKFGQVKKFWYVCQNAIKDMAAGHTNYIDQWGLCRTDSNCIILPNGMKMQYFNMREEDHEEWGRQWVYDDKETRKIKKVYGGSVTENLCQALARIVVFDQMDEVERKFGRYEDVGSGVALTVHDEIVIVVDEDKAQDCLKFTLDAMSQSPKWWPALPVGAEGDIAYCYGDAK